MREDSRRDASIATRRLGSTRRRRRSSSPTTNVFPRVRKPPPPPHPPRPRRRRRTRRRRRGRARARPRRGGRTRANDARVSRTRTWGCPPRSFRGTSWRATRARRRGTLRRRKPRGTRLERDGTASAPRARSRRAARGAGAARRRGAERPRRTARTPPRRRPGRGGTRGLRRARDGGPGRRPRARGNARRRETTPVRQRLHRSEGSATIVSPFAVNAAATSAGSPSRALRSHRTALPHRPSRDANAAMSSAVSAAAVAPAVLEASCSRARFLPDASGPAIARHEATRAATRTARAVSLRVAPGSLVEVSPAASERLGVVESSSRERVVPSCLIHQVSASH